MSDQFNPYHRWLQLDPKVAPSVESSPDYYQLVGLPRFASDQEQITRAIDKAQAKVRSHRPGAHAALWAQLLDQLKEVRDTLTDSDRKQAYDATLKQSSGTVSSPPATSTQAAPAKAPEEVAAPEFEPSEAAKSSPSAWPPGMTPPADQPPASTPLPPTTGEQPVAEPTPTAPEPSPGEAPSATDNDPIPLSARWPAAGSTEQSRSPAAVTGNSSTPLPPSALPENAAQQQNSSGQATPSGSIPLAVPLSPGENSMPSASSNAAPMAQPLGNTPKENTLGNSLPPEATASPPAGIPLGTAVEPTPMHPQAPVAVDPMAPVDSAGSGSATPSIPVGTAVGDETPSAPWPQTNMPSGEPVSAPRGKGQNFRRKSKSSNTITMILAIAAVAVIAVGAMIYMGGLEGFPYSAEVASNDRSVEDSPPSEIDLQPQGTPDTTTNHQTPANEPAEPATADPAASTPSEPPAEGMNNPPPTDPSQPEPQPAQPQPMPAEPEPADPEPLPTETDSPAMTPEPEPATPETTPTEPMPPASTAAAMTPPSPAEMAQLSKLMTTTRQALTDQNVAEAKQSAEEAMQLAKAPAHVAKAQRLQMLVTLVSEFWRAVDESIKGVEGGEVISIGSVQVAVVEITPELLIIRVAGQNKRYPRNDMSEGLAMGLANRWLDQNSEVTPLVRGAFYAVARQADHEQARAQWSQAAAQGADVGQLPQVLTDKYDVDTLTAEAQQAMRLAGPAANMPAGESLSADDQQALSKALQSARQAMSAGALADADAQLTIAANIAQGSNLEPVVKRTSELARHLRGFWDAVSRGLEGLGEGSKLTIGNTQVTVKSASRDMIEYTVVGIERSHSRNELPAGLAMAIASQALEADSTESYLQKGAFYAVAPKANQADARKAWSQAEAAGAEVSQLMLTLDDTYQW